MNCSRSALLALSSDKLAKSRSRTSLLCKATAMIETKRVKIPMNFGLLTSAGCGSIAHSLPKYLPLFKTIGTDTSLSIV